MAKPTTPSASNLRVLAEEHTPGVTKTTTFRVDPDLVQFEEGFNLRDVYSKEVKEHVEHLYLAMKEGAFIPPIDVTVETGTIICRDGYCRTTAGQRLKKELPEFTLEARQLRGNETDAVIHMLGTGAGGLHLTPLEQGKGYLRLTKLGLTIPQIAAKLGVSRVTIDKGVILAEAPVKVQKMIQSGAVSATTAIEAIKLGKEGIEALEAAVKGDEATPRTTKKGKTKKVTAKTLRGTKADKKVNPKRAKKGKPDALDFTPKRLKELADPNLITVTISRQCAESAISFIDMNCGKSMDEEKRVREVKVALETALL